MDTDLGFRTRLIRVGAWTLFPASFIGMAVGYSRGMQAGYGSAVSVVLGLCAVVALEIVLSGVALVISEAGGWVAARLSHPNSVAHRFDHSGARALIAHGEIEKGVLAFEAAVATYPEDPVPYTALARIHRDHLGQSDAALRWFRKARDLGKLSTGETKVVMREILELARKQLDNPLVVAPDLALHAHRFEGTDEAEWVRRELAELKAAIRD